jgi:hypothetical protein
MDPSVEVVENTASGNIASDLVSFWGENTRSQACGEFCSDGTVFQTKHDV